MLHKFTESTASRINKNSSRAVSTACRRIFAQIELPAETAHSPDPQNLHPTDESQLFSIGYYRRIVTMTIR